MLLILGKDQNFIIIIKGERGKFFNRKEFLILEIVLRISFIVKVKEF